MRLICQGAESIIYEENDKIIKDRIRKSYRIPEIDNLLRKRRTKGEVKLLSEARRIGVPTPRIIEVTNEKIIMENVKGRRLKELLNSNISDGKRIKLSEQIGTSVAKLHNQDIIHGDLTTSNMIYNISGHSNDNITDPTNMTKVRKIHKQEPSGHIFFIDFGLGFFSKKIEDRASDLSVLKEAIKSTHFKYLNILWENIIKGYRQNKQWKETLNCLEKIEKRGRYAKR